VGLPGVRLPGMQPGDIAFVIPLSEMDELVGFYSSSEANS